MDAPALWVPSTVDASPALDAQPCGCSALVSEWNTGWDSAAFPTPPRQFSLLTRHVCAVHNLHYCKTVSSTGIGSGTLTCSRDFSSIICVNRFLFSLWVTHALSRRMTWAETSTLARARLPWLLFQEEAAPHRVFQTQADDRGMMLCNPRWGIQPGKVWSIPQGPAKSC